MRGHCWGDGVAGGWWVVDESELGGVTVGVEVVERWEVHSWGAGGIERFGEVVQDSEGEGVG